MEIGLSTATVGTPPVRVNVAAVGVMSLLSVSVTVGTPPVRVRVAGVGVTV
ncbi:Uncharacterised protein [Mycobacteroides abscessus subsp. abscessus]|nr:Uncharacterised protein [Mycobacteroides abscessus subsp. abscessus]